MQSYRQPSRSHRSSMSDDRLRALEEATYQNTEILTKIAATTQITSETVSRIDDKLSIHMDLLKSFVTANNKEIWLLRILVAVFLIVLIGHVLI